MDIKKSPIAKNMSYVLKSSMLEQALLQAGIELETHLVHGHGVGLFTGYFWPPNPHVPHERLYIQAGVVSRNLSQMAREHIEKIVIPEFIAWARAILALPVDAPVRREKQRFSAVLPTRLQEKSAIPQRKDKK